MANFKVEVETGSNGSDPLTLSDYLDKSYAGSWCQIQNITVKANADHYELP
jgi:hypothetical protein